MQAPTISRRSPFAAGGVIRLALALLVSLILSTTANALSIERDTRSYRPDLGNASPKPDVYRLPTTRDAPVLVFVHGGAWVTGDRSEVGGKPLHFTRNGMVFVSIDYRLVPHVRVEDQLQDIDAALGWIADNIAEFGGDPDNIYVMGHSAGAHLVALNAVKPGPRTRDLLASGRLRGVISNDIRAYDIPRLAAHSHNKRLPGNFARALGNDPARWRALSPQYQIGNFARLPKFLLMFSGEGSARKRADATQRFAAALRAAGAGVNVFDGRRYGHHEINDKIGLARDITQAIDNFLGIGR